MSSIVLSFVGNQDPYSDNTETKGSIITLLEYLLAENNQIKKVILLYTSTTAERAKDTQFLLHEELNLLQETIAIIAVDEALSQDPVNLLLAANEAKTALKKAQQNLQPDDRFEFNASSGTPVMKSAWSVLQAAGYAPKSSVWQVRNPQQTKSGQARVFTTNVDTLKNEFDLQVIRQQINDYNYSGALATLENSNLNSELISALLDYGHYRLAFDFNRAFSAIQKFTDSIDERLVNEISGLRQKRPELLLRETYWKALVQLKNQAYADFLVSLSTFQENSLKYLVKRQICPELLTDRNDKKDRNFWHKIKEAKQGEIYEYLEAYRLDNGEKLRLGQGYVSRVVTMAILEYYPELSNVVTRLKEIEKYCPDRNEIVHAMEGVSEIKDQDKLKSNLREICKEITDLPSSLPFDVLNQKILELPFE